MLLVLTFLGCGEPATQAPKNQEAAVALLHATMGLTGQRPSQQSLSSVTMSNLSERIEALVDEPGFVETMADMHAEQWDLRVDVVGKPPPLGPLSHLDQGEISASVDEEPLMMLRQIITNNQPYTQMVTYEGTMADEVVSGFIGLDWDENGEQWQHLSYADGRPSAGILSSTTMWQRQMSSTVNKQRARANFVAAKLLCDDFLDRGLPELFDPDQDTNSGTCRVCHDEMDPIAAVFTGVRRYALRREISLDYSNGCVGSDCYPIDFYDETSEPTMPMAFYGRPVTGLADLGVKITEDPRFARCTVKRMWWWLHQTKELPGEAVNQLAVEFAEGGFNLKSLAVKVITHGEAPNTARLTRPGQMARLVEQLTGYKWTMNIDAEGCSDCYGSVDLAVNNRHGLHTLLGGGDGWNVLETVTIPHPERSLALAWWTEEAAAFVVQNDLSLPKEQRRLLTLVEGKGASPLLSAQINLLQDRIWGRRVPQQTEALSQLFMSTWEGSAEQGWTVVVAAMLQSPEVTSW